MRAAQAAWYVGDRDHFAQHLGVARVMGGPWLRNFLTSFRLETNAAERSLLIQRVLEEGVVYAEIDVAEEKASASS